MSLPPRGVPEHAVCRPEASRTKTVSQAAGSTRPGPCNGPRCSGGRVATLSRLGSGRFGRFLVTPVVLTRAVTGGPSRAAGRGDTEVTSQLA